MCVKSGENLISLRNKHFHLTVSLSFEVMYKNMKKKFQLRFQNDYVVVLDLSLSTLHINPF